LGDKRCKSWVVSYQEVVHAQALSIRVSAGRLSTTRGRREGSSLAEELLVSEATLYLWKRQALIDAGGLRV
jgi:hypothetical protein